MPSWTIAGSREMPTSAIGKTLLDQGRPIPKQARSRCCHSTRTA
jgi:hypothetical protein